MSKLSKTIINLAPTGMIPTKAMSSAVPITPKRSSMTLGRACLSVRRWSICTHERTTNRQRTAPTCLLG